MERAIVKQPTPTPAVTDSLDELLTVEDVAALLKVPKSWIYGRTRLRGPQRLPFIKLGKYVRFEADAVRMYLARRRSR